MHVGFMNAGGLHTLIHWPNVAGIGGRVWTDYAAMLEEAKNHENIEIISEPYELEFDANGYLKK